MKLGAREVSPALERQKLRPTNMAKALSQMTPFELGDTGLAEAVPYLKRYLHSSSQNDVRLAASAVRKLSLKHRDLCNDLVPLLINALDSSHPQVRQYALNALDRLFIPDEFLEDGIIQKIAISDEKDYNREIASRLLPKRELRSVYHLTHFKNLGTINEYGLFSNREAHEKRYTLTDISNQDVQRRRAKKIEPIYNRSLHDYVPTYINPKNPMLYVMHVRRIERATAILEIGTSVLKSWSRLRELVHLQS